MSYLSTIHGKPNYKIKYLEVTDYEKLAEFCIECEKLGYENNKDFKAMKLDKMVLPYGQHYIVVDTDTDKIFCLAGVHHFPEMHKNAYRCLFRTAILPTYNLKFSMNLYKSSITFSYLIYEQIKLVQSFNPEAEFFITTNVAPGTGADSHRLNNNLMPMYAKLGVWSLYMENVMIYNTLQHVWKINVSEYLAQRSNMIPLTT